MWSKRFAMGSSPHMQPPESELQSFSFLSPLPRREPGDWCCQRQVAEEDWGFGRTCRPMAVSSPSSALRRFLASHSQPHHSHIKATPKPVDMVYESCADDVRIVYGYCTYIVRMVYVATYKPPTSHPKAPPKPPQSRVRARRKPGASRFQTGQEAGESLGAWSRCAVLSRWLPGARILSNEAGANSTLARA
jgi:hypothetical protein